MTLSQCKPGARVRLSTGQPVVVSAPILGDVFVRDILEENHEWLPGKFADRTGEIRIVRGDEPVERL